MKQWVYCIKERCLEGEAVRGSQYYTTTHGYICYKKFINELLQIISRGGHIEKVSIEQRDFSKNPDIEEVIYLY